MTAASERWRGAADRIARALAEAAPMTRPPERAEIEEFLSANELGLALESLVAVLTDTDAAPPPSVVVELKAAAADLDACRDEVRRLNQRAHARRGRLSPHPAR